MGVYARDLGALKYDRLGRAKVCWFASWVN